MADAKKKLTNDPIVLRIMKTLEEQELRDKDLTDYLGLPVGSMSRWKYDGRKVYLKYIIPICEFLKISPNYLFLGTSDTGDIDSLTPMENEVLKLFRSVDDTRKKCIRETLRLFAEKKQ